MRTGELKKDQPYRIHPYAYRFPYTKRYRVPSRIQPPVTSSRPGGRAMEPRRGLLLLLLRPVSPPLLLPVLLFLFPIVLLACFACVHCIFFPAFGPTLFPFLIACFISNPPVWLAQTNDSRRIDNCPCALCLVIHIPRRQNRAPDRHGALPRPKGHALAQKQPVN